MMYSQRITVRSAEDTGQEEEFREDRGEEKGLKEDTGEGDESREDLGSSEEHTGSEGEDYVDPPPSLQQTDSVGCSSSLAPQTDEAPVPRETQSPCVVRLTDNDEMQQLTLQLAKNRPHRQTAGKRISIAIKSESDGREDDDHYDPNEDAGASSYDAGGDDHEDKNVNGEATASRGRYSCAICDRSFHRAYSLERHSHTHTGEKPFCCTDCGKNFTQIYSLRKHRRRAHGENELYPCPHCVECFLTSTELLTHRALHSQERRQEAQADPKEAEYQKKQRRKMGRDRARFFSCKQKEGQTVSSFITELRALASGCAFGGKQETRIRDRILCGVIDKSVLRNTLRDETQLTLQLVEEKALATEKAKTDPHLYKARKKISIQSEPYHHNEEGGGSSDDAGGGDDAGKNTNGEALTSRGRHYCAICDRSFCKAYGLERHNLTHTGEKPFCCADCDKTYQQSHSLLKHRRHAHGQDNLYPCPDGAEGKESTSARRHYCAICDRSFRRAYGLQQHNLTHTGEKPFCCADCNKTYQQSHSLLKHRRRAHGQDDVYPCPDGAEGKETASKKHYFCAICDRGFHRAYGLERHSRSHTGEKPFRCTHCDKTYSQTYHLQRHMKVHQEKPYRCPDCNLSFRVEATFMKHHQRKHQKKKRLKERVEKKPYPCSRCDEGFFSLAELTSHLPVHQGEEPQICPDCGRSYRNRRKFQRHRELHLIMTKHLCNECGKHMLSANSLRQHMLVHTGARPYICTLCGQSYNKSYYLKCHMRVHAGITQKIHACLDCGRTFRRMCDLRRHQMTHTGERPFRCLHCGKAFLRQTHLKIHMRIHTGEKPYACLVCPKSFTQSGDRNLHVSRCHGGVKNKKEKTSTL